MSSSLVCTLCQKYLYNLTVNKNVQGTDVPFCAVCERNYQTFIQYLVDDSNVYSALLFPLFANV
jgi:transcription elongation factor Elf1